MKHYEIEVTQTDYYSKIFRLMAESENEAKEKALLLVQENPLDTLTDTYDTTNLSVKVKAKAIQVYTIESLFDINTEECNDKVILLNDLTYEQKIYLGLG